MTTAALGMSFLVRPIRPDDHDALVRFYTALSDESRAARFLGATPTIPDRTATFFCGPDHSHREGIVAVADDRVIIGHVCIEPMSADDAELAIAVADAWHRRGVGKAMCLAATEWA